MKKLFYILAIMFMFSLFVPGCGTMQDVNNSIKNVNDSIQNINKTAQDVNKSIQDTGNQPKEDKGSGELGSKDNKGDSEEENDDD